MPVTCLSSTGRLRFEPAAGARALPGPAGPAAPAPPDEVVTAPGAAATRDMPAALMLLSVFGLLLLAGVLFR